MYFLYHNSTLYNSSKQCQNSRNSDTAKKGGGKQNLLLQEEVWIHSFVNCHNMCLGFKKVSKIYYKTIPYSRN